MKHKIAESMPAVLGTLLFLFLIVPFFLIWIPRRILLSPERIYHFGIGVFRYIGLVPIVFGVVTYFFCSCSFVITGRGTPIPFTPTEELIVTGLYRFVRNPLYIAGFFCFGRRSLAVSIYRHFYLLPGYVWDFQFPCTYGRRAFSR